MAIIERPGKSGIRYRVVVRNSEGKQQTLGTYGSKAEARKAERGTFTKRETVYGDLRRGQATVAGYVKTWLPAHSLSDHARETYGNVLKARILPEIGSMALTEVTPHTIRTWFRKLEAEGCSGAYMAKIKTVTSAFFQTAAEDGLIAVNPVRGIKIRKDPRKRRHALTAEEYRRMLDATPEHYRLLVETVVNSGLRWEEAMALRGTDIEGNTMHVSHVLVELYRPHRFQLEDRTKTGDGRDVKITSDLSAKLRDAGNGFVFLRSDGSHIPGEYFRRFVWNPALKAAGIEHRMTPRDMRRSHATLLRAGGADLEVVRTRLGHATIAITDRYLDERPETQDDALDALSAALRAA